jgi:hypothetical protein
VRESSEFFRKGFEIARIIGIVEADKVEIARAIINRFTIAI